MEANKMTAIGIDLGTTYSGAAVLTDEWLRMIPDDEGHVIIPSLVAFKDNERIIGEPVRFQMAYNAENSIYDVKRLIGRRFDEQSVQNDMKRWPFEVVNENNQIKVKVKYNDEDKLFSPEEISSYILGKLKEIAEKHLGKEVNAAVITVPAYFNDAQRKATQTAGKIAKLNVLRIINEPTAAALAFGYRSGSSNDEKNILIYDLGGGTFDVSILNIDEQNFQVLASNGDSHLGGEDFTNRMVNEFIVEFKTKHQKDIGNDKRAIQRLKLACEKAKRRLSAVGYKKADIEIDSLCHNVDFFSSITRDKFEQINKDMFKYSMDLVDKCLKEAKLSENNIHEVVLVGGSTRIPFIQSMIEERFSKSKVNRNINPDEAVALGAAIQAGILTGEKSKEIQSTILIDVTPLSLGVRVGDEGEMSFVVKKNSLIPLKETRKYTTMYDNQKAVTISVYEGERAFVKDNNLLGEFVLDGIERAPRGVPSFSVTFDLDANRLLTVTAIETKTGKNKSIVIKNDKGRLSQSEIDKMIKDADKFKAQDKANQKKCARKRALDQYAYDVQNYLSMRSTKNKISAAVYEECKSKTDEAFEFLSSPRFQDTNTNDYETLLNDLQQVCAPSLGHMFQKDKNRNIGETLRVEDTSVTSHPNTDLSLYDVD